MKAELLQADFFQARNTGKCGTFTGLQENK